MVEKRILVIIPAYNEAKNICRVIRELQQTNLSVNYIIIDDCSKDNTKEICIKEDLNYVSLPVNLGIGGGVQTGYKYAKAEGYDIAVQLDGDGQHDPSHLRSLLAPVINDEADIVIGSRFIEGEGFQSSGVRRIGIKFLSGVIRGICGVSIKDVTSGFRVVNKKYISFFAKDYPQDYPEPEAIVMAKMEGAHIKEVPVCMRERENGKSSINILRSFYYMVKVTLAIVIRRIFN